MRAARAVLPLLAGILAAPAVGQESVAVEAVIANQERAGSKVALPAPAAAAPTVGTAAVPADGFFGRLTAEQESDIVDRAYPLLAAKWPFNNVFVCWEELAADHIEARELVRTAVQETWEANSGLRFLGWGACAADTRGIRIAVADVGPHVKFLGKFLDGVPDGMVLNFTYRTWSPSCRETLGYCNRVIAVHEFGHAIGFAHEQNRPDTEGECADLAQGPSGDTLLTPWDPHSVMNYCNQVYSNDGVLSEFDVVAVQYVYGR